MHNLITSLDIDRIRYAKEKVQDMFLYGSNDDLSIFYFEDCNGVLYKLINGHIECEK